MPVDRPGGGGRGILRSRLRAMPPRRTTSKLPPYTRLVPGRGYRCTPYVAGSGRGARRTTITLAPELVRVALVEFLAR